MHSVKKLFQKKRTGPPSPVRKMVADPRTMLVVCYSDRSQRSPVETLYVKGMCEALGMRPSVMKWGGMHSDSPDTVPLWDAPPSERDQVNDVLPRVMKMYAKHVGWEVDSYEVQSSRR